MRIGVIGTGTIATATVQGIAADGHDILVSTRGRENAHHLCTAFENVDTAENQAVLDESNVVLLGLMPDVARAVLPGLAFRAQQRVISLMAGVGLGELSRLVAPAIVEAIAIPFPSIAQGGAPVMVCPKSQLADDIFGQANHPFFLHDEAALQAFTAAQAVLSPSLKLLELAAGWLAKRTHDAPQAESFMRLLVGSSLLSPPMDQPDVLAKTLSALNTAGGYNRELREFMLERGMEQALNDGLDQLEKRGQS